MDCSNARLLLSFHRPGELDEAERKALELHLEGCSDCDAAAQAESEFDRALGGAMKTVAIPSGLHEKILGKIAPRRPVSWPWVAAAACLLLALGIGAYAWLNAQPAFNYERFIAEIESKTTDIDTVQVYFENDGIAMTVPRQFNPLYLNAYDKQIVQGRQVAHLIFAYPGNQENQPAIAHVYVLPKSSLRIGNDIPSQVSRSNHTFEFWNEGDSFLYAIFYTGGSLTPFLLRNDL